MDKSCSTCNKELSSKEACEGCDDDRSLWEFEGDTSQNIVYLDTDKLFKHPKNPRKQLTELDELSASIKENGVMQNLTVVPFYSIFTGKPYDNGGSEGWYYVVIGHRRHAASKLAGLTKLPCVITNMDEKQQVATMLMENMQRSDLTVLEEAEGMQMMFDLGSTADEISQKTGLSKTTIKRRSQLLELDRDKLNESYQRGGSLNDYLELTKLSDNDTRNKVLESIGTNNFKYVLESAIKNEKMEAKKTLVLLILETFAEEINDVSEKEGIQYITFIEFWDGSRVFEKPKDAGSKKYYYVIAGTYISLYAEKSTEENENEAEEAEEAEEEQQEKNARHSRVDEISKSMYKLRFDFIKAFSQSKAKKLSGEIICSAIKEEVESISLYSYGIREAKICELLGIEDVESEEFEQKIKKVPEKAMLVMLFARLDDSDSNYVNWGFGYKGNECLDHVYDLLVALGYEMSDEEIAMKNGSHEIFNAIETTEE